MMSSSKRKELLNASLRSGSGSEPDFYFCIRRTDEQTKLNHHDWYGIIDPTTRSKSLKRVVEDDKETAAVVMTSVRPVFSMPPTFRRDFTSIAVGSKIYHIGGLIDADDADDAAEGLLMYQKRRKCNCTSFDTKSSSWTDHPSMLIARQYPALALLDGKIYVLGWTDCKRYFHKLPFVEVFDISSNQWTQQIFQTPMGGCNEVSPISCAVYENKKVITVMADYHTTFLFIPNNVFMWSEPDTIISPWCPSSELNPPCSKNLLVVDDIMYMYIYPILYATHINVKDDEDDPGVFTPVDGDFEEYTKSVKPKSPVFLFHRDQHGDLCFLWSPAPDQVHCLRFQVTWQAPGKWHASVMGTDMYKAESGGDLVDCVQIM